MSRAHLNPVFVGRVLFKFKIELKMANDFEEFMDAYGVKTKEIIVGLALKKEVQILKSDKYAHIEHADNSKFLRELSDG